MSWRAELRQQLSQLRIRFASRRITKLGRSTAAVWPGLFTFALLILAVVIGVTLLSRVSHGAVTPASSPSALAQVATRIATHTVAASSTATKNVTSTSTPTATRRPPTPTWTPFPTATQIAASPLLTGAIVMTQVVPFPVERTGPQMAPGATLTPTVAPTAEPVLSLVPTPTPTPTQTINEALAQPVQPGGLAGMAATATAAAPPFEQAPTEIPAEIATEVPVEMPTVTEAQPAAAMPPPTATAASIPTPDGSVRTVHVPVLMYHYISVPPADADAYRIDLSVAPDLFAAHLDAMQQAGYTPISLYALLDNLTYGAPLPEKPVVLTFDDGYVDHYNNAFPLLRERGMTATFFIVTDFIHDQRPEYLTWDMVREMYAGGMSIEAHGRNHVSLANKDRDYLIWQALGSYESIQVEIGVRPRFISYPAGEYDQQTIDIFSSAGYWAGFTTQQGATHRSDDLFRMHRVRVHGTTSPEELLRILELDW